MKDIMKYLILSLLGSNIMMTTYAVTTRNRIALSSLIAGSALAASLCNYINKQKASFLKVEEGAELCKKGKAGSYLFTLEELALLTALLLYFVIPRSTEVTCTAPEYTYNRYFGCYRFVTHPSPVNAEVASQLCANDGGRLLLLNSDEEMEELRRLLVSKGYTNLDGIFVQGKRSTGSSLWTTEDGSPLPYKGPTGIKNENFPSYTRLSFGVDTNIDLTAIPTIYEERQFICEV